MRLLISTGEVSGDLQGSFLVKSLIIEAQKRNIELDILAFGGQRMKDAGASLVEDTSSIGAIGFWEALPFILPALKAQSKMDGFLKDKGLDGLILIDYMGPNIRLGKKIRKRFKNLPIIYYIAPQEWAWRLGDNGTTDLIGFRDKILAIFQEEADFYSRKGGNVKWVGHPMLDVVHKSTKRSESVNKLGLPIDKRFLLLLPASRTQELRYIMPTLAKAAAIIQSFDPSIFVVVPAGLPGFENTIRENLDRYGVNGTVFPAEDIDQIKPNLFSIAELAIGKSGTINMELAINDVPQIVSYRVSRVTAFLARYLLRFKVDHISPVNLLLKERLVPELVQEEFTPEAVAKLAIDLLDGDQSRLLMKDGYKRLRNKLGCPGVTSRAAKEILDLVKS